jgi:hypothetical protein
MCGVTDGKSQSHPAAAPPLGRALRQAQKSRPFRAAFSSSQRLDGGYSQSKNRRFFRRLARVGFLAVAQKKTAILGGFLCGLEHYECLVLALSCLIMIATGHNVDSTIFRQVNQSVFIGDSS